MAVIVQYIVVRNGVQKMTFTTKKEADNYDKMLDIADNMYEFIESAEIDIEEKQMEDISLYLAKNKDEVITILRGIKQKPKEEESKEPVTADKAIAKNKDEKMAKQNSGSKIKGTIKKKNR